MNFEGILIYAAEIVRLWWAQVSCITYQIKHNYKKKDIILNTKEDSNKIKES